ncbi:hypothetical protein N7513_003443 [Penicillium frequentans]|nr:hypothetical protein N7513_003443 [Penicillium glabrum]
MSKSDRKKASKAFHEKCFDEMDKIGRELQLALAEKNDQKAYESQLLRKIQATEAERNSKLQQAIALKEAALAENKKTSQRDSSTPAATGILSATTRYWNAIDALQNRRLASYLPGSGVIHGNWMEQYDPLGALGHNSLPGFTESGNPSSSNQQMPGANNVFDSFV